MKAFRKIIFWLHLCLGVVGGIVIFIMCVTGAALSFEKNIIENVEHEQRYVVVGEQRLGIGALLSGVLAAKPEARPASIVAQSEAEAAVSVNLGREGTVFVDPYTGAMTGEGNKPVRGFLGVMTDLHRYIAMSGDNRPIGKAITGACNLMFLGLAITGIYIWFPRRLSWQHLRPVTWFRGGLSGKARDFNWHNTIGFWSSLVLIVLTATASVISYQWAGNLPYTLTGNEAPRPQQGQPAPQNPPPFTIPENIDALWAKAEAQSPGWKSISLRLPVGKEATFTIDEAKSTNIFGRGTLTLDTASSEIAKWEPYAEKNGAVQLRSWMRFTHTGESFGIVGQIIGFIACIGGAFLVYTGFALAFRRLLASVRGRKTAPREAGDSLKQVESPAFETNS